MKTAEVRNESLPRCVSAETMLRLLVIIMFSEGVDLLSSSSLFMCLNADRNPDLPLR